MILFKRFSLIFLLSLAVPGCGTVPIVYDANVLPVEDSVYVIDKLIMTQHHNWKPEQFAITDHYFAWGFGSVSHSSGSATRIGSTNLVLTESSTTTRTMANRIYYEDIAEIRLLDWTRKFKQWYVVTLFNERGSAMRHVLRTRNLEDAQLMVDALSSFVEHKKAQGGK
ncbi:hypothetical protein F0235_02820 [Vibrio splendidus]|uniref:hypothetical protein n=1 Tax=Vibrio splendidus TaxID=29497 RepID=UPI00148C9F80|nr:hypothetical protein [Vibrio splendidus]NOI89373.1 hypothetical protein [Vibrio splendidus]